METCSAITRTSHGSGLYPNHTRTMTAGEIADIPVKIGIAGLKALL
jgi:hypothetical protein